RMQHEKCRNGPINWRRSGHRLYPGGLYAGLATLRPDSRLRWKPFALSLPACFRSHRDIRYDRRTDRAMDDPSPGPRDQSACIVAVRAAETDHDDHESKQREPDHDVRAHGNPKGATSYRQALHIE